MILSRRSEIFTACFDELQHCVAAARVSYPVSWFCCWCLSCTLIFSLSLSLGYTQHCVFTFTSHFCLFWSNLQQPEKLTAIGKFNHPNIESLRDPDRWGWVKLAIVISKLSAKNPPPPGGVGKWSQLPPNGTFRKRLGWKCSTHREREKNHIKSYT